MLRLEQMPEKKLGTKMQAIIDHLQSHGPSPWPVVREATGASTSTRDRLVEQNFIEAFDQENITAAAPVIFS